MMIPFLEWASTHDLPPTEGRVLDKLCMIATPSGTCEPSLAEICRMTSLSCRTVQRALKCLADNYDLIRIEPRYAEGDPARRDRLTNRYVLNLAIRGALPPIGFVETAGNVLAFERKAQ